MDYEKKYKEALGWMQIVYPTMPGSVKEDAEHYFPELKESEDERIKKDIIAFIKENYSSAKSWVAWLEKQGKPSYNPYEAAIQSIAKMCERETYANGQDLHDFLNNVKAKCKEAVEYDTIEINSIEDVNGEDYGIDGLYCAIDILERTLGKVEGYQTDDGILEHKAVKKLYEQPKPRYKVGDWVVLNESHNSIYQVEKIETYHYVLRHILGGGFSTPFGLEGLMRLWTIQDAKEGDVLVLNGEVFIYAHRKQLYSIAVAHCFVDSVGVFHFDGEFGYVENGNSTCPATQKQRNTLFAKMKEAGYEWDAEKKQLIIIKLNGMDSKTNPLY